jgi:hypothetical protein
MTFRLGHPLTAAVFIVGAIGMAACGTTIDMDAVGKAVSDGITSQLSLPIASVTCPSGSRAAKAGDAFECVATPKDGGKLTVKVTQEDDKGNVKWEVVKSEGLIDLKATEDAIVKGLKEQASVDATVSCGGGKFRSAKTGASFECQARTQDKGDATVSVTMTDNAGNISWAVKQ